MKREKITLILEKISLDNLKYKANINIPYNYIFLMIIFINTIYGSTFSPSAGGGGPVTIRGRRLQSNASYVFGYEESEFRGCLLQFLSADLL